jgi:tRNA 2-selenouridine synthase
VNVPKKIRAERILHEYGHFPPVSLAECTARLQKRLGGLRTRQALSALEEKNFDIWIDILLEYYDKTYSHGNEERKNKVIRSIDLAEGESHQEFAKRIDALGKEILKLWI